MAKLDVYLRSIKQLGAQGRTARIEESRQHDVVFQHATPAAPAQAIEFGLREGHPQPFRGGAR